MTREETLTTFDSLRDAARRVLIHARRACGITDLKYAANKLGILKGGKIVLPEDGWGFPMLHDLALFEPNSRGVRPFDRFLAGPALALPATDRELARRMSGALFSLLRFAGAHETGGIWADDILDNDRRIRLMSLELENPRAPLDVIAARFFDAGPFYMGLGAFMAAGIPMGEICQTAMRTTGRLPFPRSLAATIYGLGFLDQLPPLPGGAKLTDELEKALAAAMPGADEPARGA